MSPRRNLYKKQPEHAGQRDVQIHMIMPLDHARAFLSMASYCDVVEKWSGDEQEAVVFLMKAMSDPTRRNME